MAIVVLSVLAFVVAADRLRAWLTRREIEIDYEREYRTPPIIGVMPNMPPG
ncbi:MAG: hypothetical protein R6U94_09335 [Nitriliruptoraceae bacterium]